MNKERIKGIISKISERLFNKADTDPLDFSPPIIRLQEKPPAPLGRTVLWTVGALFCALLVWAALGRLDIVAVAQGKLVPRSYLKIVQPAEQGIIKEILVSEGESVKKGQVLMRMDAAVADAQGKALSSEYNRLRLALRRIDAELDGKPLIMDKDDPAALYAQVYGQYNADRRAYESALDEERSTLEKAGHELAAAREVKSKLEQILPHYREQARAFEELSKDGYVARLQATDKERERIEKEQDLKSQLHVIKSNQAIIAQARKKMAQISADYKRQLHTERAETAGQFEKMRQELVKQQHQSELLEMKAPQNGVVKDLATHTPGTVVNPGTILMTLVPLDESLQAEVWVTNEDIGFVRPSQKVKLKISSFTFQKYGMIDGVVEKVSADSSDNRGQDNALGQAGDAGSKSDARLLYKTVVALSSQHLAANGNTYKLAPGMQVSAEIKLGTRSVLEYLFSPVSKAFHEAGRER